MPHAFRRIPGGPVEHRPARGAFAYPPTDSSATRRTAVWRILLLPACLLVLALVAAPGVYAASPAPEPPPAGGDAQLAPTTATAPGADVHVTGTGWSPGAMVNIAVCGRNGQGGSSSCAVPTSVNTTVPAGGTLDVALKVETPPVPCPCVIRVVTVTGGTSATRSTPLDIPGAPYEPLSETGKSPGRLTFIRSELTGGDTIFTWFGSPVSRRFEIEVGNMGETPITDPVFRIGVFEGVFAPSWEDKAWTGTIQPGQRVTVSLPIELKPRQHGEFRYRVMYGDKVVDEVVLTVGRPWGVYLFGALAVVVVPMAVWRLVGNLIRAVKEHRKNSAEEREREVGVPGAAEPGTRDPDRDEAGTGPGPVPRRTDEPVVVGTRLFPPSAADANPASARAVSPTGPSSDGDETRVLPATRAEDRPAGGRPPEAAHVLAGKPGEERGTP
ncbi:hypothetical protein LO772_21435 [Yinghuangia sp. ASG 101]|uniref:hypothetical protein n=1 Tax=Yinghuangia sp. ASG 101 TaxID=2896848 RepID=UPI001E2E5460|nr:hypothetical protein [Yinghuangia sp. ASG 101]UGQ09498.1 hypothetical protein LO772_21435 [Yinghuangia sp. ASG 101]